MRRVQCRNCGIVVEEVPWSDGKHQLTKAYLETSTPEPALGTGTQNRHHQNRHSEPGTQNRHSKPSLKTGTQNRHSKPALRTGT